MDEEQINQWQAAIKNIYFEKIVLLLENPAKDGARMMCELDKLFELARKGAALTPSPE